MEESSSPILESATCTICGLKCDDRSAFNAHIRAHLKDKLTNRRKLSQQQANSTTPREQKRAKVTTVVTNSSSSLPKPVKDKPLTNIQSLLPSSPLPLSTTSTTPKDKPDLEALLSQLQQKQQTQQANDPLVMAELAACKPIPPPPAPRPVIAKASAETTLISKQKKVTSIAMPCTPEISDMEEDLMSYEMEMNRIDFHNDLAFLLDQIEKDFESPTLGQDFKLDTPPDSDCENDNLGRLLLSQASAASTETDLLGFDRFSQRIDDNSSVLLNTPDSRDSGPVKLIQSPASVAKVGKLPAKTLAVLNKLPAKLFVGNNGQQQLSICPPNVSNAMSAAAPANEPQRFVDVVKVESSSASQLSSQSNPLLQAGTQCIINIECRNPNQPAKIIQTFRAIDTGSEIKLVPAEVPPVPVVNSKPPEQQQLVLAANKSNNQQNSSHCPICNKCITNKNMARHLEKHNEQPAVSTSEKKFICKYCCKAFSQRSHLSRHAKAHTSTKGDLLTCKVCGKVCKNRMSLAKHKAKHLSCIHCSALFENKFTLQDHLLKAHTEKAIVSLVQPPEQESTRLDLDDLGSIGSNASHSVDYSFSPTAPVETIGDSLADIADSNYFFCGGSDITDDLYSTDLFSTTATSAAQTC